MGFPAKDVPVGCAIPPLSAPSQAEESPCVEQEHPPQCIRPLCHPLPRSPSPSRDGGEVVRVSGTPGTPVSHVPRAEPAAPSGGRALTAGHACPGEKRRCNSFFRLPPEEFCSALRWEGAPAPAGRGTRSRGNLQPMTGRGAWGWPLCQLTTPQCVQQLYLSTRLATIFIWNATGAESLGGNFRAAEEHDLNVLFTVNPILCFPVPSAVLFAQPAPSASLWGSCQAPPSHGGCRMRNVKLGDSKSKRGAPAAPQNGALNQCASSQHA